MRKEIPMWSRKEIRISEAKYLLTHLCEEEHTSPFLSLTEGKNPTLYGCLENEKLFSKQHQPPEKAVPLSKKAKCFLRAQN